MKKLWENRSKILFGICAIIGACQLVAVMMSCICWLVDKVTDFLHSYRKKRGAFNDEDDDEYYIFRKSGEE